MQVGVIGAGAIGGWLAAGFVDAGADVVILARGDTLAALRRNGLGLLDQRGQRYLPVRATDDPAGLRNADILLLGVKAHDLPGLATLIGAALGPQAVVVPAINGLPFWFFAHFGGPARGLHLDSVDPGGVLARLLPADRVVGAVVHAASVVTSPGHIHLIKANRLLLGDAGLSANAPWIAEILGAGGIPAAATDRIHREVWSKLWGNSNMNPLSALARADLSQLLANDATRGLIRAMMVEMSAVGARIGLTGFDDQDARMDTTRSLGAFRTSMLQDVEAGRRLELGPILGAVVELARHLGQPAPMMEGIYGLISLLDHNLNAE